VTWSALAYSGSAKTITDLYVVLVQSLSSSDDADGAAAFCARLPLGWDLLVGDGDCCGDNTDGAAAVGARLPLGRDLVSGRGRPGYALGRGCGEERGEDGEHGDRV
jgi:hypothetical protein